MTAQIQHTEPTQVTAGDTWTWTKSLSDYPAGTWTLTYYLRSREGEQSFTATADGADHLVTVAAATTAGYKAGRYGWTAVVTSGSERYRVGAGEIEVLPDPANMGAGQDPRSHARKMLEAIEATLERKATSTQIAMIEYTIGTRGAKFDHKALSELRDKYRSEVKAEEAMQRLNSGHSQRLLASG